MKVYVDGVLLGSYSDFAFSDYRFHWDPDKSDQDEEPHQ